MDLYKLHDNPEKLHGHNEAHFRVPVRADMLMDKIIRQKAPLPPEFEKLLISNPKYAGLACRYAKERIRGRWPEAEKNIAKDSSAAYEYARNVIEKRWPEGEDAIAKSAITALHYVMYVTKQPFPKAEDAIADHASYAIDYAKAIKKRFKKAEPKISKLRYAAFRYIEEVIDGPWPEAEDEIAKDSNLAYRYARYYLRAPFPKGEKAIAKAGQVSAYYAITILKHRFEKGEKAIKRLKGGWQDYCSRFNLKMDGTPR